MSSHAKESGLTTGEAAAAVGISRATLQAWVSAGKVEAPPLRSRPGEPPARNWNRVDVERLRAVKEKIYRRGTGRGRKRKGVRPRAAVRKERSQL